MRRPAKAPAARPTLPLGHLGLIAVLAAPAQAAPFHTCTGRLGGFSGNQGVAVGLVARAGK